MAGTRIDVPDAPACPLLGLVTDPRSHYTYPHRGHRCFATKRPAATDAQRQAAYCLSTAYPSCDRFRAFTEVGARTPSRGRPTASTVVYVFRSGDSLARIAAAYGLTVEQLAAANSLHSGDIPDHGTRLVIPLGGQASGGPLPQRGPTGGG